MYTLITGGLGYVGSVVSKELSKRNKLILVDTLTQGSAGKRIINKNIKFEKVNILNKIKLEKIFKKFQIENVIHLAAIVGDPASKKFPKLTIKTNVDGSNNVLKLAKKYNVKKFIFFSTCSNYGLSKNNKKLNEKSKLNPISLYAKTKIKFEKKLISDKSKISKIIFRISTLYGMSPRMRFDLTINEFTRLIFLGKNLDVYDADTWRPYLHLKDLSLIVKKFLNLNKLKKVNVYNIGFSEENYTKKMICKKIIENFKNKKKLIKFSKKASKDRRNYKIDFSKLNKLKFKKTITLSRGIKEISSALIHNKKLRQNNKFFSNI